MENNKIRNGKLIEYLKMFPEDKPVSILLANIKERKVHDCENMMCITDMEFPIICIEIGDGRDMDDEEKAACDAEEREGKWRG